MIRTNAEIEKIKPTEKIQKFNLEKGLYLEVTPRGTKVFRIQLSRSNIKPFKVLITLGRYPDINIKEARSLADIERLKFKQQGPIYITGKQPTFEEIASAWYERMVDAKVWGEVNATDVLGNIEEACHGKGKTVGYGFGRVEMTKLSPEHVTRIVDGITGRGAHSVARDFLNNVRRVIEYYNSRVKNEFRTDITPDDIRAIKRNLPEQPKEKHHHFLLPSEMPDFLKKLRNDSTSNEKNKMATLFLLLTGVRSSNVRFMSIQEINFEKAEWTIPADSSYQQRTKNGETHIVPLSSQALDILRGLLREREYLSEDDPVKNTQYIFYGDRNPFHPISSGTIRDVCLNMGYKGVITPHGFRSSFSTWANELCESNQALWSSDAIEAFLNHTPRNKVRRAYNRYQYIEPRRILAQTWADQVFKWMND